jgi:hypothetical protein
LRLKDKVQFPDWSKMLRPIGRSLGLVLPNKTHG